MNKYHPSSVCCLFDQDRKNDDHSELTSWSSQADNYGIKLSADPYFYYTLDGRHPPKTEEQELIESKMQIARQQEKIDILSSKLSQCEVENEALKIERRVFVDELALGCKHQLSTQKRRHSTESNGSMHFLIDSNAKLVMENELLQVMSNVTKKSFRCYIKEHRSRRSSKRDKETIENLSKEIKALRKQPSVPTKKTHLTHLSEQGTAITSLETFDLTHAPQDDVQIDSSHRSNVSSIPEQADWTNIELYGNKNSALKRCSARRHTMSMVSNTVKYKAPTEEAGCRRKTEELLVDFGETPRRTSTDSKPKSSLTEGDVRVKT